MSGHIVRGTSRAGAPVWVGLDVAGATIVKTREAAAECDLEGAVELAEFLARHARDVRIVGEDGVDLPTYEEALNAVILLREAVEQALAHHREARGMTVMPPELHGCPVGALHYLRRTLGRTP